MTALGARRPSWDRARLRPLPALVTVAAFCAAALCATLLVRDVRLGVAFIAALVYVPIAFFNPPLALAGWLTSAFLTALPGMGAASNRALYLLVVVWVGALFAHDPALRARSRQAIPMLGTVIAFLVWVLLSLLWAPMLDGVGELVVTYVLSVVVYLLVTTLVVEPRHARWLASAFVVGATLSVLAGAVLGGLSEEAATSVEGRLQGGVSDPNYLAAAIVPAILLAGGLAVRRGQLLARLALASAVVVLAAGLAATESRGGLLAAGFVALGALATWRGRRAAVALAIGLTAFAAAAWFVASPSSWERITSSQDGGSGRTDIWQVAWRVAEDHPLRGVGLAQFPVVSPDYIREPGALSRADLIVDQRIVVHNVYLQLWVETGIVGLALLLVIVVRSLLSGLRAADLFTRAGDADMAALSRAASLALLGSLTASFFLSNLDDRRLWLLLALCPALLALARRPPAPADSQAQRIARP